MKYTVTLSAEAETDLRAIYTYIAFTLSMPETARGLVSRIENSVLSLSEMPFRFQKYGDTLWQARGLRVMSIENYCIFYIPNESRKIVTVLRVLYGASNLRDKWSSP